MENKGMEEKEMQMVSDFVMPPFARIQWASKKIKDKYEPMWIKAGMFFREMETRSVARGLRDATTGSVKPYNFLGYQQELLNDKLYYTPLRKVGHYSGASSYHPPVVSGKPWQYYGCITRDIDTSSNFIEYNDKGDHIGIGGLLGFPDCCTNFFSNNFSKNGVVDLTWNQAINTDDSLVRKRDKNLIVLKDIPWQNNNIFRAFNVITGFQAPCSLSCSRSLEIANNWIEVAKEEGVEGIKELELFLRLPYEWNSYKGIAYIKTPLFKMSVNSNFSAEKYVVRVEGSYFPPDAPNGSEYPWDGTTRMLTTIRNENKLDNWSDKV